MLRLENISVTIGRGTKLAKRILHTINLCINPGEFIAIVGSNGAGKSTLLQAISGSLPIENGHITINNQEISTWSQTQRARLIAQVQQDPRIATIESMTIEENLCLAYKRGQQRSIFPYHSQERITYFKEKLSLLHMGLECRLEELTSNLSGGQRQALSLIMALVAQSELLLLDEITAALDPKIAQLVMELTAKIVAQEKKTTIMITHNMEHAIQYSDRIVVLKDGKIVKEYTGEEKHKLTITALTQIM